MSWLGGSISSLTGQLSNLTKDILTEGTEEISGEKNTFSDIFCGFLCVFFLICVFRAGGGAFYNPQIGGPCGASVK